MKTKTLFVVITSTFVLQNVHGQVFTNLNFESATFVSAGLNSVQFNQAFPGWIGTAGGVQQTLALSNAVYLDTAGISIINSNFDNSGYPPGGVIQGKYTAILQSGLSPTNESLPVDVSLSQTGLVPMGTESLLFSAHTVFDSSGAFNVSLGGQNLSLNVISNALNYTVYGANISAWAGDTAQLSFTVLGENPHVNDEYFFLDNIQFSASPIPEPCVFCLSALSGLFLASRRWKK
jgi:hypothetical protein